MPLNPTGGSRRGANTPLRKGSENAGLSEGRGSGVGRSRENSTARIAAIKQAAQAKAK